LTPLPPVEPTPEPDLSKINLVEDPEIQLQPQTQAPPVEEIAPPINAPKELPMHTELQQGNLRQGAEHIAFRHYETSPVHTKGGQIESVGRFFKEYSMQDIRNFIRNAMTDRTSVATVEGKSLVIQYNTGEVIGVAREPVQTTWIKIVLDRATGKVITSYPVAPPSPGLGSN
jgi:hypothetical protein